MNIFASYKSPEKSAVALDNKRVVKMILESAQMLSTALYCHTGKSPYKPAFANHPCTIWARETRENYEWLLEHFYYLFSEYTYRYGKKHKCEELFAVFKEGVNDIKAGELIPFADCTGEVMRQYQGPEIKDIHDKYKMCLALKWQKDILVPKWTGREIPQWNINNKIL